MVRGRGNVNSNKSVTYLTFGEIPGRRVRTPIPLYIAADPGCTTRWQRTARPPPLRAAQPAHHLDDAGRQPTAWLCRNPGYTFDYKILGCPFDAARPLGRFNWTGRLGPIRWKLGWKAWNMWDSNAGEWKARPWGLEWRIPLCATISR
ncbi:protein of unknown function [Ralstonia solanacearum CMR15]|nr:protein of unknown function [Ralstonia solanacearum CMR15]